ncbi:MAG: universal stress protein [Spirochaetia bacterium]|nr:universal stress protein [Spirochaetota bacterium]MDW8034773.1 universal stress protein [Nitrososphaerota archaeon]MDW8113287.1 universal stress protein [Spirochaetia bacterium]
MNIEKIYVAIDFKTLTNSVLSYALWLTQSFNCKNLCLFHIMEYTLTPPAYLIPYINKEKKRIEENLRQLTEKLISYVPNTEVQVVFGRLIESIIDVIKEKDSLVVLGFKTHVTRPSTSERILKGIKVPVFVVKGDDFSEIKPSDIKIKKILCPVDFSEYSLRALNLAKVIAKKCNCELKVLHVIPEHKIKHIIEEPSEIEKFINYLKENAQEHFLKIDRDLKYEIIVGIPTEKTLEKAKDVDLVVMGSKGRSYAEAVIIGSVAETVIKNSPKPVLLVH